MDRTHDLPLQGGEYPGQELHPRRHPSADGTGAKHHLIIAHEVTNVGHDKHQLANMARQAKEVTGTKGLTVLADRGYFSGEQVVACEAAGATPIVPKPLTSGAKADGRFGKQDFIYQPETDTYRCPAGEHRDAAFAAAPPQHPRAAVTVLKPAQRSRTA